jgi:nucleotidyltransferase/DNA polymerase involved in DNA repair
VVALRTCDFSTAETAAALDLDALSAGLHRSADGTLHGSAEGYTVLKVESDLLSNELCGKIHVLDLDDIDCNGLADALFNICAELINLRAASADDQTRFCAVDVNADLLGKALDLDARNAGCIQRLLMNSRRL